MKKFLIFVAAIAIVGWVFIGITLLINRSDSNTPATGVASINEISTKTNTPRPTPTRIQPTPTPSYQERCNLSLETIEYDDLYRNIDSHQYRTNPMEFTGEIIQVIFIEDGIYYFRVDITPGEYGIWTDTILVTTDENTISNTRILEDDIVRFCGKIMGLRRYESVLGAEIEIPHVHMWQLMEIKNE